MQANSIIASSFHISINFSAFPAVWLFWVLFVEVSLDLSFCLLFFSAPTLTNHRITFPFCLLDSIRFSENAYAFYNLTKNAFDAGS